MNEWQTLVRQFNKDVAGHPTSPAMPMLRHPQLRAALILEEAIETAFALIGSIAAQSLVQDVLFNVLQKQANSDGKPNIVEAIDGIADTIVVCLGAAEDIGINLDPFFREVMRSNLEKVDGPVRADGKLGKPPGWTPPDIAGILMRLQSGWNDLP